MGQFRTDEFGFVTEVAETSGPELLEEFFRAGGLLAHEFPGYTPRTGQVTFARGVHFALKNKRHIIAECPTGVGKSIGYAVPAAIDYVDRCATAPGGKADPVIIVTANIALQEQLIKKDLPLVQRVLGQRGLSFDFGLLKGRNNYLCMAQHADARSSGYTHRSDTAADLKILERIMDWADITTTGDRSELSVEPTPHLWRRFSIGPDDCPRGACGFFSQCYAFRAQRDAKDCSIIVTNYHVLYSDLNTGGMILPPGPIILDEGHEAAEIARDVLGGTLTLPSALSVISQIERVWGRTDAMESLRRDVGRIFAKLLDYFKSAAYSIRLRQPGLLDASDVIETLHYYANNARAALDNDGDSMSPERKALFNSIVIKAGAVTRVLTLADELTDGYVTFLEELDERHVRIVTRMVDVAPVIRDGVFTRPTVVVTSATLSVGGSFNYIMREIGAPKATTDTYQVDSPFDWESNAILVVPPMPDDPNSDAFRKALPGVVRDVVALARGRTLALFTSYKNMNACAEALRGMPYRLLRQGDAQRTDLVDVFRRDVHSVLFGTNSFWTGVDVTGEALSCVVIDKLPFPMKDDPVLDVRSATDDNSFMNLFVPAANILLKQGVGRLIRSTSDRGVVVILDPRIHSKGYGPLFLRSLPRMPRTKNLAEIRAFLDGETLPPPAADRTPPAPATPPAPPSAPAPPPAPPVAQPAVPPLDDIIL